MASSSWIEVTRLSDPFAMRFGRGFDLVIDGSLVTRIKNGKAERLPLEAGQHVVRMKSHFVGSRPVSVVFESGTVHYFETWPTVIPALAPIYLLFFWILPWIKIQYVGTKIAEGNEEDERTEGIVELVDESEDASEEAWAKWTDANDRDSANDDG